MNQDFDQFMSNYRGAINRDLAQRYAWNLSDLERRIKADAAKARRLATEVKNTQKTFGDVLNQSQELALGAAGESISRLATDLEALKPWAKVYSAWSADLQATRQLERLDKQALQRWSGDQSALRAEATDLIEFVQGLSVNADPGERPEVQSYLLQRHAGAGVAQLYAGFFRMDRITHLKKLCEAERFDEVKVQRLVIEFLGDELSRNGYCRPEGFGRSGLVRYVGIDDFNDWRQFKNQAKLKATALLGAAKHH